MKNKNTKKVAAVIAASIALSGCSAMSTAIQHHELQVQSKMSDTLFLDPVSEKDHTVYLQVRNSTNNTLDVSKELETELKKKGYTVVRQPSAAHYWLQTNIIKLEKLSPENAMALLNSGYGSAIAGGGLAAMAMSARTSSSSSVIGAGLIGSAVGFVADNVVENVNYSMLTDVQIVEHSKTSDTKEIRHKTRIVSNAQKMNLDLEDARPALVSALSKSVTGLF